MDLQKVFESIKSDLLTENIKTEIQTLFEATIKEKVDEEKEKIQKEYEEKLEANIKEHEEKTKEYQEKVLVKDVSDFIEICADEWMEENKLETKNGIKAKLFDSLVGGMKDVFKNHNINVEESEALKNVENDLEIVTEDYNKLNKQNLELKDELSVLKAGNVFEKETRDLTIEQKEKLKKMTEDFETDDLDSFTEKLNIIKEKLINNNDNNNDTHQGHNDDNFKPNNDGLSDELA